MKKLLALAAAITLLCTAALAEFDFYALKDTPDAMTYTVPGTADTVVRPALAPIRANSARMNSSRTLIISSSPMKRLRRSGSACHFRCSIPFRRMKCA